MFARLIFAFFLVLCLNPSGLAQRLLSTDSSAEQIRLSIERAQSLLQQGKPKQALDVVLPLIDSIPEKTPATLLASAYEQIGEAYMALNDYPKAQQYFQPRLTLVVQTDDKKQIANAYHDISRLYRYQTRYQEALNATYEALAIYQSLEDIASVGNQYNQIGIILEHMGHLQDSLQAHKRSLAIDQQRNNLAGIASGLYNVGEIHKDLGDHNEALQYFQDALKIDHQVGNLKNIAYSSLKVGSSMVLLGRAEEAKPYAQTAYDLFVQIQAPRDQDWARWAMADIELALNNLDAALAILLEILPRCLERDSFGLLVDIYHYLAKVYISKQNYPDALNALSQGIELAQQNNEWREQAVMEGLYVGVYEALDNAPLALAALKRQKALEDAMLDERRVSELARLQSEAAFLRKEQEITLLKKDQQLQILDQQKTRERRNLVIAILVSTFVIVFLLQRRVAQKRLNSKLTLEVEKQTRTLKQRNQQLNEAYQAAEQASLTDQLTGLHNRRFLEQNLEYDLLRSHRAYSDWLEGNGPEPVEKDLVFFLIDIDRFKAVNDTYGHAAGDAILMAFQSLLKKVFRQSDFIVRWGGEEFMVVSRFTDRKQAIYLAKRLLQEVAQHTFTLPDGNSLRKTCSIGFAAFPFIPQQPICLTWRCITNVADYCLYAAKSSGRNATVGLEGPKQGINPTISDNLLDCIHNLVEAEQMVIKTTLHDASQIKWQNPKRSQPKG
jgi:diguanylate cyclase (GGDEF)-like protein